jgi:hypothetical protein
VTAQGVEIERTFLVGDWTPDRPGDAIRQGYLAMGEGGHHVEIVAVRIASIRDRQHRPLHVRLCHHASLRSPTARG